MPLPPLQPAAPMAQAMVGALAQVLAAGVLAPVAAAGIPPPGYILIREDRQASPLVDQATEPISWLKFFTTWDVIG